MARYDSQGRSRSLFKGITDLTVLAYLFTKVLYLHRISNYYWIMGCLFVVDNGIIGIKLCTFHG